MMQRIAVPGHSERPMDRPLARDSGPSLALLAFGALIIVLAHVLQPAALGTRTLVVQGSGTAAAAIAAGVILWSARRRDAWDATRRYGIAVFALALIQATFLAMAAVVPTSKPFGGDGLIDFALLAVGGLLAPLFASELREHFDREDWKEVLADVFLLAAASGTLVYLVIRPEGLPLSLAAAGAIWACAVMIAVIAWGALALWLPSPVHVGLALAMAAFGVSALSFGHDWFRGAYLPGDPWTDLPVGIGALFLAALLRLEPRLVPPVPDRPNTKWGRGVLTAVAVGAACASLAFVAVSELHERDGTVESSILIGLLGGAVAARILFNQVASIRSAEKEARALEEKDEALQEADGALTRLREVHGSLSQSEERLRLLLNAAADGIVELDGYRVIRRANEAFCSMLGLSVGDVVGIRWAELAERVEGGASIAELPETGRATLVRRGQDLHIEARSSELPGSGELLVVRDVTAARVADQTIRSLLQFLQDRDEDRTRLLQRTNAAIESERNRIARDLHDGPVQGVSAASLSLEAVLLMLKAGEDGEGMEVLTKVRQELAEEADNLRRLMAGLRPPLLEERGLVPALRENVEEFGHENKLEAQFGRQGVGEVPQDLETLAYRVVQEALSNAGKHAEAARMGVAVEAVAGQLRIEVTDNGVGFDAAKAREFLRMGRVGLASMRERVELANGTFMVHSTPGRGTTVVATLPLESVPGPREFAVT